MSEAVGNRYQSVIFGLLTMPVGVAVGFYVASDSTDSGFAHFYVYAALAAFIMSTLCWWLLIKRPGKPSNRRAAAAGVLSGLLSHWLCWYLMLLWSNADYWLLGGSGSSLGEAPMDPLIGLIGVLAFSFFSWLMFGWLTVGLGVLTALWWASRLRRQMAAAGPS